MLDTAPANYRLTGEKAATVLALFAEFDPTGQRSSIVDEHLAEIRSVPANRAEELAAALVGIAPRGLLKVLPAHEALLKTL
jgi:hypothetical protein